MFTHSILLTLFYIFIQLLKRFIEFFLICVGIWHGEREQEGCEHVSKSATPSEADWATNALRSEGDYTGPGAKNHICVSYMWCSNPVTWTVICCFPGSAWTGNCNQKPEQERTQIWLVSVFYSILTSVPLTDCFYIFHCYNSHWFFLNIFLISYGNFSFPFIPCLLFFAHGI